MSPGVGLWEWGWGSWVLWADQTLPWLLFHPKARIAGKRPPRCVQKAVGIVPCVLSLSALYPSNSWEHSSPKERRVAL